VDDDAIRTGSLKFSEAVRTGSPQRTASPKFFEAVRTGSPQRTASPKFSPKFHRYPNLKNLDSRILDYDSTEC